MSEQTYRFQPIPSTPDRPQPYIDFVLNNDGTLLANCVLFAMTGEQHRSMGPHQFQESVEVSQEAMPGLKVPIEHYILVTLRTAGLDEGQEINTPADLLAAIETLDDLLSIPSVLIAIGGSDLI